MEVIIAFIISIIQPLIILLMAGRPAWGLNIKYWPWFVMGLFAPFIGVTILLCRLVKDNEIQKPLSKPVSSEEIFDPVLHMEEPKIMKESRIQFLARA
jgi:hypothetical protein